MREKLPIAGCRLPMDSGDGVLCVAGRRVARGEAESQPRSAQGFSLVELLVAMTLLTLIVVALMAVFSSTQRAFRASVTQTDILEGSRETLDLMSADLRSMTPCYGQSNYVFATTYPGPGPVNLFVQSNAFASCSYYGTHGPLACVPLLQSLPGSSQLRTNVLNFFFLLGRQNTKWIGIGYVVNATNCVPLFPLYRFYAETNIAAPPYTLFNNFITAVDQSQWANMSHVMDGVVHLALRAYDINGYRMTNTYQLTPQWNNQSGQAISVTNLNANATFLPPYEGELACYMYSNMVPAAVEIQMGVLEDRILQRAEALGSGKPPGLLPQSQVQWNYLTNQSGHVHLFHQRVAIPNVDSSAYQ